MSTNGGHRTGPGGAASVTGAVPVVLVRDRPGGAGESARTVHLVPLPDGGQPGAVSHVISTPAPDTEPAASGPAEELSPDAPPTAPTAF
ncbi:MAG: hypothetical protein ACRDSP_13220 [Pseudonocardiaceae bacterium]